MLSAQRDGLFLHILHYTKDSYLEPRIGEGTSLLDARTGQVGGARALLLAVFGSRLGLTGCGYVLRCLIAGAPGKLSSIHYTLAENKLQIEGIPQETSALFRREREVDIRICGISDPGRSREKDRSRKKMVRGKKDRGRFKYAAYSM